MACLHPPKTQRAWAARDDTVKSGSVMCVACCECGEVISIKPLPIINKSRDDQKKERATR